MLTDANLMGMEKLIRSLWVPRRPLMVFGTKLCCGNDLRSARPGYRIVDVVSSLCPSLCTSVSATICECWCSTTVHACIHAAFLSNNGFLTSTPLTLSLFWRWRHSSLPWFLFYHSPAHHQHRSGSHFSPCITFIQFKTNPCLGP